MLSDLCTVIHNLIHNNIMRFRGELLQQLEGKAYTYPVCIGHQGEQAVVIPLTPTETYPMAVKCNAGDDGKVYFVV